MIGTDNPQFGPELLDVKNLTVSFGDTRPLPIVRGVSLRIRRARIVALVGESGSGKSLTALGIVGLTHLNGELRVGQFSWCGVEIVDAASIERLRGTDIGFIPQDPLTALNPLMTIGQQLLEVVRQHTSLAGRAEQRSRCFELLETTGLTPGHARFDQFPHELSGGMRQRAAIALSLAGEPRLLIADEPTTALDVTIQGQILDLLLSLRDQYGLAVLIITHDLGVVARVCDEVAVMYAGRIVERGTAVEVLSSPRHPYSSALIAASPRVGQHVERLASIPGQPPNFTDLPLGCPFHPRCSNAQDQCETHEPELQNLNDSSHAWACFHPMPGVTDPRFPPSEDTK